jgi:hypothetical protein
MRGPSMANCAFMRADIGRSAECSTVPPLNSAVPWYSAVANPDVEVRQTTLHGVS